MILPAKDCLSTKKWILQRTPIEPIVSPDQAKIEFANASSVLTEKNDPDAYRPYKAFDSLRDTGWFEKKDGPGIG